MPLTNGPCDHVPLTSDSPSVDVRAGCWLLRTARRIVSHTAFVCGSVWLPTCGLSTSSRFVEKSAAAGFRSGVRPRVRPTYTPADGERSWLTVYRVNGFAVTRECRRPPAPTGGRRRREAPV